MYSAQISNVPKIRPVAAALLYADTGATRTDGHDEASSRFSPFWVRERKTFAKKK
jgi:hypothetical protein